MDGDDRSTPTRRQVLASAAPAAAAFGGCLGLSAPTATVERRERTGLSASVDARVGFAGDAMLGRNVDERWRDADDPAGLWGPLATRLRALDGFVLNLECCLSTRGERWPDKTYYFRGDPGWAVPALEAAGTTCVSLGNNHVLDFGATALDDTRRSLSAAGSGHAGAGPDWDAAIEPAFVSAGPLDVAVIGLSERWSEYRAGADDPGTAYLPLTLDSPETRRTVTRLLDRVHEADPDLVVASLHWGPNWEEYPEEAPGVRPVARRAGRRGPPRATDLLRHRRRRRRLLGQAGAAKRPELLVRPRTRRRPLRRGPPAADRDRRRRRPAGDRRRDPLAPRDDGEPL